MPRSSPWAIMRIQGLPPSLHERDGGVYGMKESIRTAKTRRKTSFIRPVLRGSSGPGPALGLSEGPVRVMEFWHPILSFRGFASWYHRFRKVFPRPSSTAPSALFKARILTRRVSLSFQRSNLHQDCCTAPDSTRRPSTFRPPVSMVKASQPR